MLNHSCFFQNIENPIKRLPIFMRITVPPAENAFLTASRSSAVGTMVTGSLALPTGNSAMSRGRAESGNSGNRHDIQLGDAVTQGLEHINIGRIEKRVPQC